MEGMHEERTRLVLEGCVRDVRGCRRLHKRCTGAVGDAQERTRMPGKCNDTATREMLVQLVGCPAQFINDVPGV